ncbi:MAG: histidinol-phosphatase [Clostridia bacterium]|nr:histidinol-phosphatase [Clostridia bacterium]
MIANYHTHTFRCNHASGKDEEYIQKAIAENVKILGFSDHAPNAPRKDGYLSYYKMRPDETEEYYSSIRALGKKYSNEIEIHVGFETEYFRSTWNDEVEFLKKHPPEYLILGQHYVDFEHLNGKQGNHSDRASSPCDDKTRIKPFADAVIEAMSTGLFSCVAHPDVLTYTGEDQDYYLSEMARIIEASKKYGVPLEYNLLGQSAKRQYPRRDFWQLAGEMGVPAVIGCDAHNPERVADKEEIAEARKILSECNVKILETIELIKPFK